jgi:hypothetical protein
MSEDVRATSATLKDIFKDADSPSRIAEAVTLMQLGGRRLQASCMPTTWLAW